jgi:hypothetical protein
VLMQGDRLTGGACAAVRATRAQPLAEIVESGTNNRRVLKRLVQFTHVAVPAAAHA